jgi:tRNA A37 threonylcarbamoyladenosine dehydratase
MDINPALKLTGSGISISRACEIVSEEFDYVLDCIDSITPKLNLLQPKEKSEDHKQYGAGGKMEASKVKADIIYCQLFWQKTIRRRLKE